MTSQSQKQSATQQVQGDVVSLKYASLFSGIGGLDYGLIGAGHECIMFCESDPGAKQVLKEKHPGLPVYDDVANIISLPKGTEMVAAGFPCIDVSKAGKRQGLDGESTGLVKHLFRLLRQAADDRRPVEWVLLENVEAVIERHGKEPPVMAYVIKQLQHLGYMSWAYRVISSAGFGLPNRRKRVFLIASLHGDARDVLLTSGANKCTGACVHTLGERCYSCHMAALTEQSEISYAIDLGNARSGPAVETTPTFTRSNDRMLLVLSGGETGMLRIEDAERLQGFPVGYTAAAYPIQSPGIDSHRLVRANDDSAARSYRHDLLANCVPAPMGFWLGLRLAQPYHRKYVGVSANDRNMDRLLQDVESTPSVLDRRSVHPWNYQTVQNLHEPLIFSPNGKERIPGKADEGGAVTDSQEIVLSGGHQSTSKPAFQTSMLDRVKKGKVTVRRTVQTDWEKQSFPQCAWYVRGTGAFAVEQMSDAPVLTAFQPLGTFIKEVGRPATEEETAIYASRMREHGWQLQNLDPIFSGEGAQQTMKVTRVPGLVSDVDMIPDIVWAKDGNSWWPAEVWDPLEPFPGMILPEGAIEKLSAEEQKASLPHMGDIHLESGKFRRVLAIFYPQGRSSWQWLNPADTLPFEPCYAELSKAGLAELSKVKASGKSKQNFELAIEDAKTTLALKEGKNLTHQVEEMRRRRAATAAASIDIKQRCGRCYPCMHTIGGQRRSDCFTQQMMRSALGGHSGAQIAVCGSDAIGARIKIWWGADEKYYEGWVAYHDPVRQEHTVLHDDGDVGMYQLWQSREQVTLLNTVGDWPKYARHATLLLRAAQETHHSRRKQLTKEAGDAADAAECLGAKQKRRYKQDEEKIMQHNRQMFSSMLGAQTEAASTEVGAVQNSPRDGKKKAGVKKKGPRKRKMVDQEKPCGQSEDCNDPGSKNKCAGSSEAI